MRRRIQANWTGPLSAKAPEAMQLATLMVLTPDLDEAQRFYQDILGLDIISRDADVLVLDHSGIAFHVFQCERSAPGTLHGQVAGTIAVFGVSSIEEAMARLRAQGVVFLHEMPATNRFGRYATFKAPGGNVHELFEPFATS